MAEVPLSFGQFLFESVWIKYTRYSRNRIVIDPVEGVDTDDALAFYWEHIGVRE